MLASTNTVSSLNPTSHGGPSGVGMTKPFKIKQMLRVGVVDLRIQPDNPLAVATDSSSQVGSIHSRFYSSELAQHYDKFLLKRLMHILNLKVLKEIDPDVSTVMFKPDGTWAPLIESEDNDDLVNTIPTYQA